MHLLDRRVGVVGPNGCGKSNVMESVRWVLGESSAKEMRADAMDAVIFNGSSNRKPISRASVELIFDNSLGGASGEWSQYAEISVKRVIEREKGSSYFINNAAVRRRDVADLFLGTGLGGRAYAIIGQNTISRIVEARPEELRVTLEEAAGISKYKDRRRDTELRLRDTRENLARVEDICRELQKQINRLTSQAAVAEQYNQLQTRLRQAEGQLWLLKKRDASRDWEACKAEVEHLASQLEAQLAALRASENQLETTRQQHYMASDGIQVAQAGFYEANAEVSNLEYQLKQTHDARERMGSQLQQIHLELERNATFFAELGHALTAKQDALAIAEQETQSASNTLNGLRQVLPIQEANLKEASEHAIKAQQALLQVKQRMQIEQNNHQHQVQLVQEAEQRVARYQQELVAITLPPEADLTVLQAQLSAHQQALQSYEQALQQSQEKENRVLAELQQLRAMQMQAQQALSDADAEIRSLAKLQQLTNPASTLSDWLTQAGLNGEARLWQQIEVDATWSAALEAVLGAKLNALMTAKNTLAQRPPAALVLGLSQKSLLRTNKTSKLTPLLTVVRGKSEAVNGVLSDWLCGIYLLKAGQDISALLAELSLGECLVNTHGDIFTPHSVAFNGAEHSPMQGILEREQRLTQLKAELPALQQSLTQLNATLVAQEQALQTFRMAQQTQSQHVKQTTAELHASQMQISQLKQARELAYQRQLVVQQEIVNANARLASLMQTKQAQQTTLTDLMQQLPGLDAQAQTTEQAKQDTEQSYFTLRENIQLAEKLVQERTFNKKIITNSIHELTIKISVNIEEKNACLQRQADAEHTLKQTPMETLKANLTLALIKQQLAEDTLAQSRNRLAEHEALLQQHERLRLQHEQQLHPLRDALEQGRLREQEARLHFEQCMAGLAENGLLEVELAEGLSEQAKASELSTKIMRLQREIEALGAVNLAAIEELASGRARKFYLDSQMQDLNEASQTLEDAIRRIDKETRGKLQATYDEANRNFNELFNVLFGGGQARLELLGDEILDTGIQVVAQPPGKKNASIQLLSGGEKALTAIALVFALFRLNPAPFCLMDEVDAPLDDSNTERFCNLVKKMSEKTQFLFVSHNKVTMEMAQQLIGVTMQESGVSRIVDVDIDAAMRMQTA